MPIRKVAGNDAEYTLIVFDENGKERREPDGTLMSERVKHRVASAAPRVTDVFFMSHGWKGDVPAAIEQYDAWVGTMEGLRSDSAAARQRRPEFAPLVVGLHWPSLPWGVETIPAGGGALLSAGDEMKAPIDTQVEAYASRIADTPAARAAIRSILDGARRDRNATALSPAMRAAYTTLFAESGLESGDASGRPGADQGGFDPDAIIADARTDGGQATAADTPGLLGFGDRVLDALLMPLRQLSFWKMKDRGRRFGETGGHELLSQLQGASTDARFHLMGHSFGCIVVSAAVAGAPGGPPLPRPVDSLFLVQGALSLWSFAGDVPYAPGTAGYFNRIVKRGLVRGPLVTTRSTRDTAVGRFYPMGANLAMQLVLGKKYPAYGGIGTFGIQGVAGAEDMPMQPATFAYRFSEGRVYNLEASGIIKNGTGASGAHSDIAHPEVGHAFWSAVLAAASFVSRVGSSLPGSGDVAGSLPTPALAFARPERPASSAKAVAVSPPAPPAPRAPSPQAAGRGAMGPRDAASVEGPEERTRGGGLLGSAKPPSPARLPKPMAAAPSPAQPSPAPTEQRWINAEFEDHALDEALLVGRWYTLAFDVDVKARASSVAKTRVRDEQLFPEGTEEVQLMVQLDSADFEISEPTRPLRLPREGRSHTKARFDISPRHDGPSTVKATIHKDGNFIQQMDLTFEVGATRAMAVQVTARGRPPSAADLVQPRDVGLSISPTADGYECVAWGAVSTRARLPIRPALLASAIDAARRELMKVVMQQGVAKAPVFQVGIDIPDADRDVALRTLARAGALLFQKMFFGPAAGADSKGVGEFLRRMVSDRTKRLKLQIVAESVPVPWGLLYVGDAAAGAKLDWDNFIGMRHVIEQIPLQNTLSVSDSAIPSNKPHLAVSVNVNSGIDVQMGANFVAQQQSFWEDATASRKRVRVTTRTTSAEVSRALADGATDDQILYFYCHAESTGLTDIGGPDASCLVLTDKGITLGELNLDAPITAQLRGSPLVFINACESAEMSPAFYDGFVPYFMAKGARGVVGTECQTPALFAAEWARRFFERFLDGEPLGEAFLHLRREFLEQHNNPLGLLYAVHCDGDTQIDPALTAVS
jgi:hypothetical protein